MLANRIPRLTVTRFMGWFSQIRHPWIFRPSMAVWQLFTDLDLSDARKKKFDSLHDCFTRELMPGARRIDPDVAVLTSPCDGIVGSCGKVEAGQVFQAKGFPYSMQDLFGPTQNVPAFQDGVFVTIRLTSAMYHRFHALQDGVVEHVTYLRGDTWNVNPITLKRVGRLFCRNERAVLRIRLSSGHEIALVPVAAILVASLRLHFLDLLLHGRYDGPAEIPCPCRAPITKGGEVGYFQHGSTIIVFAPQEFQLCEGINAGTGIRLGQRLLHLAPPPAPLPEHLSHCQALFSAFPRNSDPAPWPVW